MSSDNIEQRSVKRGVRPGATLLSYFMAFGLFSIAPVLLAPSLITGVPLPSLEKLQLVAIGLLAGSYLTALLLLLVLLVMQRPLHKDYVPFVVIAIFGLAFFLLYGYQNREIGLLLVTTVSVACVCLWIFQRGVTAPLITLAAYVVFTGVVVLLTDIGALLQRASGTLETQSNIRTIFYNLQITTYPGRIPRSTKGGGISLFGDKYLLATGDGRLYSFSHSTTSESLKIQPIPLAVPLNTAQFRGDVSQRVDTKKFRVTDVNVQKHNTDYRIFAVHHFWKSVENCFVLRISVVEGSISDLMSGKPHHDWQTIFETTPCLPLKDSGHAFAGHQSGGRIQMLDGNTMILTVGDHEFDGNMSSLILPQDDSSSYGKTILVDVDKRTGVVISKGHRNPQGLHIDSSNSIWLTEHGPQGGDELNLVIPDTNYGWPFATYGIAYGKPEWPLSRSEGAHREYEAPVFAWVPGIGISNLVSIESDHFNLWKSDLIVASLARKSLFRIRVDDGRVRYLEEIEVGRRIRTLVEGHDGQLILWTDDSALVTISRTVNREGGEQLFVVCAGCHRIADGTSHGIGPDLFRIGSRRPGAADGFQYSDALVSIDSKWNRRTLDKYLENPSTFAPGTTMIFPGISDLDQRQRLVEYLLNDGR